MHPKNSLLLSLMLYLSSIPAQALTPVTQLETVVVTATREEKLKRELAESVSVFDGKTIESVSPSHPSELINRAAGAYVNNLGGEGHMTAIRQPITTRGVYLYLEDGVPVRPTGFFNHNALYEVNIPQSGNIEVVKGPGSALYGSDAIGGMVNSLTPPPPQHTRYLLNTEAGSHGWQRVLLNAGGTSGDHGVNLSVNYTNNEGYRDEADYDRSSLSARWDYKSNELFIKTLLSYTQVNQSGISSLEKDDYQRDTAKNRFHSNVALRKVEAWRLSSDVSLTMDTASLNVIPYYRHNTMTMSPSWMVSYDPNERESHFKSLGVLTKYRYDINEQQQIITGIDIDYSPSTYKEGAISHSVNGDLYTGYQSLNTPNYDFDAKQTSISQYIQYEGRWFDTLITTLGVRYDYFKIRYEDQLNADTPDSVFIPQLGRSVRHRRPQDQKVTFDQLSPKLGLVYQLNEQHDIYANYRHAFTIPSVGTLFRSGSTSNTAELDPIKARSVELGLRGQAASWLHYEAAIYQMTIKDDLISVVNGFNRSIYNAGETEHKGIEIGVNGAITGEVAYALALTKTKQTYKTFSYTCCFPFQNIDVSGNDIGKAPDTIANLTLTYSPLTIPGLRVELEWEHLGKYFTDDTNTSSYDGHDLLNVRAAYAATDLLEIYARVQNLTDELYSTYTSNQVGDTDISYRPGSPRTVYAGIRLRFKP